MPGAALPQSEELAVKQMEAELISMFHAADVDQTGTLAPKEFTAVLRALDLGLTSYQMMRLLAEADENEDGTISYAEFVPVGLRLLQAYKAKASAARRWNEKEHRADELTKDMVAVLDGELHELIHAVEERFREAIPGL